MWSLSSARNTPTPNTTGLLPLSHFWTVNWSYICATLIKRVEPATYLNDQLLQTARQYWYDAYGAARYPFGNSDKSGLALVIHDGFQPLSTFDNYMVEPEFEDVLLDTHNYQVFNDEYVAWNWDQHISVSSFLRLMKSAYTTSERL